MLDQNKAFIQKLYTQKTIQSHILLCFLHTHSAIIDRGLTVCKVFLSIQLLREASVTTEVSDCLTKIWQLRSSNGHNDLDLQKKTPVARFIH